MLKCKSHIRDIAQSIRGANITKELTVLSEELYRRLYYLLSLEFPDCDLSYRPDAPIEHALINIASTISKPSRRKLWRLVTLKLRLRYNMQTRSVYGNSPNVISHTPIKTLISQVIKGCHLEPPVAINPRTTDCYSIADPLHLYSMA